MRERALLIIRLPSEIEERLAALAEKTGRTKAYYAREAILRYLEDLEDYYLAAQVAEEVRNGKENTHSKDEVIKVLGLANWNQTASNTGWFLTSK